VKYLSYFGRANLLVSRIVFDFHLSIDRNSRFRLVGECAGLVGECAGLIRRFALPKTRITA